jgi:hypothetical protein
MDCELDPDRERVVTRADGYDDHGRGHVHYHDGGGNDCCHWYGRPERSVKSANDYLSPHIPPESWMIVIDEQERHRGSNKCGYNHKRAAGSIMAVVDHEHLKRIQSQVGPM